MNRARSIVLCFLILVIFFQPGCSQKAMVDDQAETKMDAPLRIAISEATQNSNSAPIQCLIKLSNPLDSDQRSLLTDTGINILTVVNDIVTIEGSPESLQKAAALRFVHSLSLSQKR